jgi:threonine synthase
MVYSSDAGKNRLACSVLLEFSKKPFITSPIASFWQEPADEDAGNVGNGQTDKGQGTIS